MSQSKVRRRRVCDSCREVVIATAEEFKVHVSACLDGARKVATPEQVATDRVDGTALVPELSQNALARESRVASAAPRCETTLV